jgi:NADH-quinone oxidoreductase subunit N
MSPIDPVTLSTETLRFLLPEIVIVLIATAMMTAGPFVNWPRRVWSAITCFALLIALGVLALPASGPDVYSTVVSNDALAMYARIGLVLAGLIVIALAEDQVDSSRAAEFFGAILMVHAGAMLVASANELVFLFAGLELVSIPTYLLLYLPRRTLATQEAATKYFFLSIFSSAILLFGLAYLYGLTGVSNLKALAFLTHQPGDFAQALEPTFAVVALVFVLAGLSFRVAAVPFHFYAPDVYQGSPLVMAALLSWIPKAVGFLALLRTLTAVFGIEPGGAGVDGSFLAQISDKAVWLTAIVAVATMTLGNTVALAQDNLKRLLAYSSIAHAGYLLIGVAAAFRNGAGRGAAVLGADAVVFYLGTYALMTLGAFGVILALGTREQPVERIDDLAGLSRTHPWAALALAICLFSLAGIPPLAGFWGKLRIFQSALEVARGEDAQLFLGLVVLGAINAAIGAYYYLRIVVTMAFREPGEVLEPRPGWPALLAVGVCAGLSLFVGLVPGPLADAARMSGVAAVALPSPTGSPLPGPVVEREMVTAVAAGAPR